MDSPFSVFSSCFPSTQITPEPAVTLSSSGLKPAVSSLISRLSSVSLTLSSSASLRLILENPKSLLNLKKSKSSSNLDRAKSLSKKFEIFILSLMDDSILSLCCLNCSWAWVKKFFCVFWMSSQLSWKKGSSKKESLRFIGTIEVVFFDFSDPRVEDAEEPEKEDFLSIDDFFSMEDFLSIDPVEIFLSAEPEDSFLSVSMDPAKDFLSTFMFSAAALVFLCSTAIFLASFLISWIFFSLGTVMTRTPSWLRLLSTFSLMAPWGRE